MPLPEAGSAWPPPEHAAALARFCDYDAWYSGNPDQLAEVYKRRSASLPKDRPSQYRGGVVGKLSRWFWGTPVPAGQRRPFVHMPLPADIATASADLLFARPPTIRWAAPANAERWEVLDDQLRLSSRLHEGAEIAAPLGGVYLRAGHDKALRPHPLLSVVHADSALPTFTWGYLSAVTFVRELSRDGSTVVRYLERYELVSGRAWAFRGVFSGSPDKLGREISLDAHDDTRGLLPAEDLLMPVLPVTYIPNMLPSREDRGSDLGRSDYEGVTGLFDHLDETATALLRDVRLAKARAFVPTSYLETLGRGAGAIWDPDSEIYAGLDIPPTSGFGGISIEQAQIRVAEHVDTMQLWMRQAVSTAGYSARTFGLDAEGAEMTATEVMDLKDRSNLTRAKKTGYWGYGLRDIATALMWIDRLHFGGTFDAADLPSVDWPPSSEVDPLRQAQTLQALAAAEAVSTFMKVKSLHPDWEDGQITDEVARIKDDTAVVTAPPEPDADPAAGDERDPLDEDTPAEAAPPDDEA